MMKRRGYTLAELAIVVGVLGVVLAAVYLFFFTHGDAARLSGEQNRTALEYRVAMDEVEGFIRNAGLHDPGTPGEWHPVLAASADGMTYIADIARPGSLGPEDTLTLARDEEQRLLVTDAMGETVYQGSVAADIDLAYLDGQGEKLSAEELITQAGRDRIREISFNVNSGEAVDGSSRSVTPPNLAYSGTTGPAAGPTGLLGGPTDNENFFLEDFEVYPPVFIWEDSIEAELAWVPVITEDFETSASWISNWMFLSTNYGRIQRNNTIVPHGGSYTMRMDASVSGVYSHNAGIWRRDLSAYDENVDQLRLHFWWKGYDEAQPQDGVFFPEYTAESTTLIDSEDFTGFRFDARGDWTYWNTAYGNIIVSSLWPYDGNYINMDSRMAGQQAQNRIMWENDLTAWSASTDLELRYYFTDRTDLNDNSSTGDFAGLAGTAGIAGPITLIEYLYPETYPNGSWLQRTVDLDSLVPAGYDWSEFRVVFGQAGSGHTTGQTTGGGISIDNVSIWENVEADTVFEDQLLGGDPESAWQEATVDLDQAARNFSNPFDSVYDIAFCQYDNGMWSTPDGIAFDDIAIEIQDTTIVGWTHGAYSGVDQWEASDHTTYGYGEYCWSVNSEDNYDSGTHSVWLQTPDIDLTSYSGAARLSFSFRHQYEWAGDGDGCNVQIWNPTTSNWDLLIPYWGYYTASVPGLGGQAGWTGSTSGWNYCVSDITPYAGQVTRVRFEYGLQGPLTADGWDIDYCRVKLGVDWPQIIYYGWPNPQYADWFAYQTLPGYGDPSAAGSGSRAAGNDMVWGGDYDTYYENFTHNALVSPPVAFDNSAGTYYYIEFLNCLRSEFHYDTGSLLVSAFSSTMPDTSWVEVAAWSGSSTDWWKTRIYMAPYLAAVSCDTVVFMWMMEADGSSSDFGGWNLDSIACFSSTVPLPELRAPLGGDYTGDEAIVYIPPDQVSPVQLPGAQGVVPINVPDSGRRRTEATLR